jgi:Cys-rich protein (TIGR01571 family)
MGFYQTRFPPQNFIMQKWESIETLAAKLNMPFLLKMSTRGITAEDIMEMKYSEAEQHGISQDDYLKLKTYLKKKESKLSVASPPQPIAQPFPHVSPVASVQPITPIYAHNHHREWSKSLFSCFDNIGICCVGSFCPCVLYGVIKSNRNESGCGTACLHCFLYSCMASCALQSCLSCSQRQELRREYNIRGDSCEDFCIHCCCTPCAMTQEWNEIEDQAKVYPSKNYPQAPQMGTVVYSNQF